MKKIYGEMIKKVVFSFLLVCLSLLSKAATYYVSSSGNDTNSGLTESLPWATLTRVNSATFKAGDQILFQRGGTFYGSLTINQSGATGNPITIGAYGTGLNPVITGFTIVSAWTNLGNNIWESTNTVSSLNDCNIVTINGANTAMGRYPKITDSNKGYLTYQTHLGQTSITSNNLTGAPNWTGAEVVIRNQAFHLKRSIVSSQSGSTINFGDIGEGFSDGNGFFFQNDIRCCTQQNEWYYNPSSKKIRIYSTSQPSNVNVASIENLITINSNYLVFNNITFTGANGCAFYCWDHNPRYNHITISNCTFSNIGVSAIYTLANDFLVSNNTISNCNISAIETSYGGYVEISNNTIQNIGLLHGMRNNKVYTMCNAAVDCGNVTGWTVKNNSIQNVGFNGISCWASDSVLIQNNFVNNFCSVLDDGGAIYTYAASGTSFHAVKINGNICINGIGAVEGSTFVHNAPGIYLDQGSNNEEVCYNSIANVAGSGIHWTSAGNNNAHHNTVYNASENQFSSSYYGGAAPIPTGDKIKNNIFVSKMKGTSSMDYQKCLYIYFSGTNPTSLILAAATLDSNYYARPIADDNVIFVNQSVWANSFKTLSDWQTFSSQDTHSHKSCQTLTNVNDFQFEYNETKVVKTIAISQPMIDVKGNKYVGNVTLQPYTSIVLMKDYNPSKLSSGTEITSFSVPGQIGSSVINSNTIGITMPYGTSLTNLAASFTLSTGASAKVGAVTQASGATSNSYVNPVVYAVTAQDKVTINNWTVTVSALSTNIVSGGTYELIARHSGKVIGIKGASTNDIAAAEQETYMGSTSQQFIITDLGTGYFKVSPVSISTKALDVNGQSTINGTSVIQYTYQGSTNQQWKLVSTGSGYYQIVNRNSNKCLDVSNASTADGSPILQYTCGTAANQQFTLSRLKSVPVVESEDVSSSAISEGGITSNICFYPNPCLNGKFFINLNYLLPDQNIEIRIFGMSGDLLYRQRANGSNVAEVNSGLKAGIYILKISGGQTNISKKLVVK